MKLSFKCALFWSNIFSKLSFEFIYGSVEGWNSGMVSARIEMNKIFNKNLHHPKFKMEDDAMIFLERTLCF